jgi:hypothetical protein
MMSIYKKDLPKVFPYFIQANRETVNKLAKALMEREDLLYGSSFAVTADFNSYGRIILWLSDVSYEYLTQLKFLGLLY